VSNIDQIFVSAGINLPWGRIAILSPHFKTGFGMLNLPGQMLQAVRADANAS
jgi:hypothetical protein